ncbi:diguanylate cyclase [Patescibacteria group bacterium]|nr:diguanylate cyclase [Patescibacteria group bacterium]
MAENSKKERMFQSISEMEKVETPTELHKVHVVTQLERLAEIEDREDAIRTLDKEQNTDHLEQFNALQEQGSSAREIRSAFLKTIPGEDSESIEKRITIAKAVAAVNRAEGRAEQFALTVDGLTQLKRDGALREYMISEIRKGSKMGAIHIDIDKFKLFNEVYGYSGGDDVLRHVGQICRAFEGTGMAARKHDRGEELVFIFTENDFSPDEKKQAEENLERMLQNRAEQVLEAIRTIDTTLKRQTENVKELPKHIFATEKILNSEGEETVDSVGVTASAGITVLRVQENLTPKDNAEHLLDEAEQAAVDVKKHGFEAEDGKREFGDGSRIYSDDVQRRRKVELTKRKKEDLVLKTARESGEFETFQEPRTFVTSTEIKEQIEKKKDIEPNPELALSGADLLDFAELVQDPLDYGEFPEVSKLEKEISERLQNDEMAISGTEKIWWQYAQFAEVEAYIFGEKANTDSLTGLKNREIIGKEFHKLFYKTAKSGENLTIAILDLDHFKDLNDAYGHKVGDKVLRQLGRILKEIFRTDEGEFNGEDQRRKRGDLDVVGSGRRHHVNGTPGRQGGEEFVILLPGMDAKRAKERIEERFMEVLRATKFSVDEETTKKVTASMGLADIKGYRDEKNEPTTKKMFERANVALKKAKVSGRDQVVIGGKDVEEEMKKVVYSEDQR